MQPFQFIRLARPANIITAYADIFAGYAAAGIQEHGKLLLLLASTTGLYAGGVVFNDVFDAKLDARERPERPIPSGAVSVSSAAAFGALLLLCGILSAWACSRLSGELALGIAASALFYDAVGKHHLLFGPFNMGLCRGLNLLLGLSVASNPAISKWAIAGVTLSYIAGITSLSRGEVRGGTNVGALLTTVWLTISVTILTWLGIRQGRSALFVIPFFALLLFRIAGRLTRAIRTGDPMDVRAAVKAGVLSLIVVDCCIATLFAGPVYGVAVLLLYVPATLLAKWFAVT
ncbi:MAG TPA: UbiA-like protein EboC [Candidatus Dormibacteraeota bacterium]|nr:UbiA-like protein EboC [Candidatus Dormibacteraeota bacterium]